MKDTIKQLEGKLLRAKHNKKVWRRRLKALSRDVFEADRRIRQESDAVEKLQSKIFHIKNPHRMNACKDSYLCYESDFCEHAVQGHLMTSGCRAKSSCPSCTKAPK